MQLWQNWTSGVLGRSDTMPRKSETENVRKRCEHYPHGKWKTCSHPWYLDYQRNKGGRFRDNLDALVGFMT